MLKINDHGMTFDQTKVGYSRQGRIECCECAADHKAQVDAEVRRKEASPLYGSEGKGQVCECCGSLLVG